MGQLAGQSQAEFWESFLLNRCGMSPIGLASCLSSGQRPVSIQPVTHGTCLLQLGVGLEPLPRLLPPLGQGNTGALVQLVQKGRTMWDRDLQVPRGALVSRDLAPEVWASHHASLSPTSIRVTHCLQEG